MHPIDVTQVVAPKRAALAEANRKLEAANKKLAGIRARVKELQDKVAALEESFVKATEDKNTAIAQVRTEVCELCRLSRNAALAEQDASFSAPDSEPAGTIDISCCVKAYPMSCPTPCCCRLRKPPAKHSLQTGWSTACRVRTSAGVRPSTKWMLLVANW